MAKFVTVEKSNRMATVTMGSKPVNTLTRGLISELIAAFKDVAADEGVDGMVLTSSCSTFCAGLDLGELLGKTTEGMVEYWTLVQDMWITLYGMNKAAVAAINGPAPAGGTLLCLGCDYRAMTDAPKAGIGLIEPVLGIPAPTWLAQAFVDTVTSRSQAELHLTLGTLFSPQEALAQGLVNSIHPKDDVYPEAVKVCTKLMKISPGVRSRTKGYLRAPALTALTSNRQADIDRFLSINDDPAAKKALTNYVKLLKMQAKKKAAKAKL